MVYGNRSPEANSDIRELGGMICLACTGVKMHASVWISVRVGVAVCVCLR